MKQYNPAFHTGKYSNSLIAALASNGCRVMKSANHRLYTVTFEQ